MKIKLFDHQDYACEFEIGNLEDISRIDICVLSGDEVATVYYKDYDRETFDPSDDRCVDFFDAHYELYVDGRVNRLEDLAWVNRTGSYDYEP